MKINAKLIFTTIYLVVLSDSLVCQSPKLLMGSENKEDKIKLNVQASNSEAIYSIDEKEVGAFFTLSKISLVDMKINYSVKIQLPEVNGDNTEFKRLSCVGKELYLFCVQHRKKEGLYKAYAVKISDAGILDQNPVLIDEIKSPDKSNKGYFKFILSEDKNEVVVFHKNPIVKNTDEHISFKVFDSKMNLVSSSESDFRSDKYETVLSDLLKYNNGKVYFLARDYKENVPVEINDHKARIVCFDIKTGKISDKEIKTGVRVIYDINLKVLPSGEVVLAGLFSNTKHSNDPMFYWTADHPAKSDGLFCMLLDNSCDHVIYEVIKNFLDEFPKEQIYNAYLNEMMIMNDGSINLITESYAKIVTSSITSGSPRYASVNYSFDDIVIFSMDPKTKNVRLNRIKKSQFGDESKYYSYVALSNGSELTFLLNADKDVAVDNGLKKELIWPDFKKVKNAETRILFVKNDGTIKVEKNPEFNLPGVLVKCQNSYNISDKHAVFLIKTKDGEKLSECTFN